MLPIVYIWKNSSFFSNVALTFGYFLEYSGPLCSVSDFHVTLLSCPLVLLFFHRFVGPVFFICPPSYAEILLNVMVVKRLQRPSVDRLRYWIAVYGFSLSCGYLVFRRLNNPPIRLVEYFRIIVCQHCLGVKMCRETLCWLPWPFLEILSQL